MWISRFCIYKGFEYFVNLVDNLNFLIVLFLVFPAKTIDLPKSLSEEKNGVGTVRKKAPFERTEL